MAKVDGEYRVGVRELRGKLSEHLRRVKAGETLVITEHGHPVARIIRESMTGVERFDQMVAAGRIHWNGRRWNPKPVARTRDGSSVSDLIIAARGRD